MPDESEIVFFRWLIWFLFQTTFVPVCQLDTSLIGASPASTIHLRIIKLGQRLPCVANPLIYYNTQLHNRFPCVKFGDKMQAIPAIFPRSPKSVVATLGWALLSGRLVPKGTEIEPTDYRMWILGVSAGQTVGHCPGHLRNHALQPASCRISRPRYLSGYL